MMKINRKQVYLGLAIIAALYVGYLIKKSIVDKGYPSEGVEKEIMLGHYVVMLGMENTKANRDKYKNMTLQQLYKELGISFDEVESQQ